MIVRLVPYSEVFVTVTMSLDEAALLSDTLAVASEKTEGEMSSATKQLRTELEASMQRASELQEKRGY